MGITEIITIICIGIGLAMDAFAVAVVSGGMYKQLHIYHAVRMALFFGLFQAVMPLIGYAAGQTFEQHITAYDHWVAFGLLMIIGGKMIYEAFQIKDVEEKPQDPTNIIVLFALSVATSIDALAVGITLSLITSFIFAAAAIIGVTTFLISWVGWEVGKRFGHFFEIKIEFFGGLILIGIGLKILIQHLFFLN